jgi:LysM repeat protein
MNKSILLIFALSFSILLSSCGAKKKTRTQPNKTGKHTKEIKSDNSDNEKIVILKKDLTTEAYITKYADIAVEQMKKHNIPASITLAQGVLESRSGNSDLTQVSNNHFGIKCHRNWEGARTYYDDDRKGECFRVYDNSSNSYDDHSQFLVSKKRYANLFKLNQGDYKGWAKGLKKAGYATDKSYPQKLIAIIEKYELYKYDEKVIGKPTVIDKNADFYIVQQGDGLYGIARKFDIQLKDLMDYNGLTDSNIQPGQKLFLKRQKDNAATKVVEKIVSDNNPSKVEKVEVTLPDTNNVEDDTETPEQTTPSFHIVKPGENLYQIAYKYRLAVPDLRRWNRIKKNEIKVGQRIWIKDPKILKTTKVDTNSENTHTVAPQETLYSISKMYHLSINELMQLNNLSDYTIYVGQVLLIK